MTETGAMVTEPMTLTQPDATLLQLSMKPFKLRIDWTVQNAYPGEKVEVELHVMDEEPKAIHRCATPPEAAGWARKWLADRGFDFLCDIDTHQRCNHTHITLHAKPKP